MKSIQGKIFPAKKWDRIILNWTQRFDHFWEHFDELQNANDSFEIYYKYFNTSFAVTLHFGQVEFLKKLYE